MKLRTSFRSSSKGIIFVQWKPASKLFCNQPSTVSSLDALLEVQEYDPLLQTRIYEEPQLSRLCQMTSRTMIYILMTAANRSIWEWIAWLLRVLAAEVVQQEFVEVDLDAAQ